VLSAPATRAAAAPHDGIVDPAAPPSASRRKVLRNAGKIVGGAFLSQVGQQPHAAVAFPLAPLGSVKRVGAEKTRGLTTEQIAEQLEKDLVEGQYFVTVGVWAVNAEAETARRPSWR
jgi:hypothetical protein